MTLFAFSIAGSVLCLLMMGGGFVWLGRRGQLEVSRLAPEEAADLVIRGWRNRPAATWFKGLAWGLGAYGEKPTREIIQLLRDGNWSEGLPWAIPALGALGAFFFWPLLIGQILGLTGFWLWAMTLVFLLSATSAAWPR